MAILSSELKFKQSYEVSDALTNGGRMGTLDVPSSYFPNISGSERQAGITRYRKFFLKNTNSLLGKKDLTLISPKVFLRRPTPAGDYFMIKQGAQDSVQSDADDYTSLAGCGHLNANASVGATTLVVSCETTSGFRTTGLAYITDGTNGEFVTISNAVFVGSVCTLTISALQYSYSAFYDSRVDADITSPNTIGKTGAGWTTNEHVDYYVVLTEGTGVGQVRKIASNTNTTLTVSYSWEVVPDATTNFAILKTYVSMVEELSNIVCTNTAPVITSPGGGTLDAAQLFLYPEGAVKENWTLTFTDSNNYTISGGVRGQVGTGQVSGGGKPANGNSFYFELTAAAFLTPFAQDDTITFSTYPSAEAFWVIQKVAPNTPAYSGNRIELMVNGDSA